MPALTSPRSAARIRTRAAGAARRHVDAAEQLLPAWLRRLVQQACVGGGRGVPDGHGAVQRLLVRPRAAGQKLNQSPSSSVIFVQCLLKRVREHHAGGFAARREQGLRQRLGGGSDSPFSLRRRSLRLRPASASKSSDRTSRWRSGIFSWLPGRGGLAHRSASCSISRYYIRIMAIDAMPRKASEEESRWNAACPT